MNKLKLTATIVGLLILGLGIVSVMFIPKAIDIMREEIKTKNE